MMKKILFFIFLCATCVITIQCNTQKSGKINNAIEKDTSLVNTAHLDYLYVPVTLNGIESAGVYIYAEAPDYRLTPATGEGYTCVDDVARAVFVYIRRGNFSTDTSAQHKTYNLIEFLLQMQSANGYFYNFILEGNQINTTGVTSINTPDWWSWRALHALTEAGPAIKANNPGLSEKMDLAVHKLITRIKSDLVNIPRTTKLVNGIMVPQWLPAKSGTDQAAILILALIPYCTLNNDTTLTGYIKKLADGIVIMQQGDAGNFPFGAFLSWENTWHAYACDQSYALIKAGSFLNDPHYTSKALIEIDHFYPWLLQNGLKSSFSITNDGSQIRLFNEKNFEQIAYGVRPMVFAAAEAYRITGLQRYADIAGHMAAWFLGANVANKEMYSVNKGRCYDAINSTTLINLNSGAESTIEALLTMQKVEDEPAIKTAMYKYKRH